MSASADDNGTPPTRAKRGGRPLLDRIDGPADVRALPEVDLAPLAQEVREHISDTVGEIARLRGLAADA
jgi:hypothetical protein